mmetsp:Transcript_69035/g.225082  ORF Transcript_69035/g.225082 Transcript_69035/m.225082 type:complete len:205 (+) Transcript_69035:808-1422(+)
MAIAAQLHLLEQMPDIFRHLEQQGQELHGDDGGDRASRHLLDGRTRRRYVEGNQVPGRVAERGEATGAMPERLAHSQVWHHRHASDQSRNDRARAQGDQLLPMVDVVARTPDPIGHGEVAAQAQERDERRGRDQGSNPFEPGHLQVWPEAGDIHSRNQPEVRITGQAAEQRTCNKHDDTGRCRERPGRQQQQRAASAAAFSAQS